MVTMKQARRKFSGRTMISPALTYTDKDGHKHTQPRKNARFPAGASFRVWARLAYAGASNLSPKLSEIVR